MGSEEKKPSAQEAHDPAGTGSQKDNGEGAENNEASGLDAALAELATARDQLLRKAAEFENYKKRTEGEFQRIIENASEQLILNLLPILDDFDRLLKSSKDQASVEAIRDGCALIAANLNKVLALRGLRPFESVGKPFDVHYHDALLQMPRNDVPPNTVIEEVARGYQLNDKVIRHAKVVVSTAATGSPDDGEDSDDATASTGPRE